MQIQTQHGVSTSAHIDLWQYSSAIVVTGGGRQLTADKQGHKRRYTDKTSLQE